MFSAQSRKYNKRERESEKYASYSYIARDCKLCLYYKNKEKNILFFWQSCDIYIHKYMCVCFYKCNLYVYY